MAELSANAKHVEAFLFMEGGPISWKRLSQLAGISESEGRAAAEELKAALLGSGLAIIETETEISLSTSPETAERIKATFKEQLQKDIGEAALEVLATLLYRGPSKRSEIDYIRGVNTSSTIRNLLARGLIERSAESGREYVYRPTSELLAHLGVTSAENLPEYATIRSELAAFEESGRPQFHAADTTEPAPGSES